MAHLQALLTESNRIMSAEMNIKEAILGRHSVRRYLDQPIDRELVGKLTQEIARCNEESGLHIQLILNEAECFDTLFAHYGKFKNANNYIALVGKKTLPDLEERCGYYGERLVLFAQMLGLRTCWVAGSYGKSKCKADVSSSEKLVCVISIGYGEDDGVKHKSKPVEKVCPEEMDEMPVWFRNGVRAALMAPTAINQQQFTITLDSDVPVIKAKPGPYSKIDLGIVKYHFEAVSGRKCK